MKKRREGRKPAGGRLDLKTLRRGARGSRRQRRCVEEGEETLAGVARPGLKFERKSKFKLNRICFDQKMPF
jgi:hypothetical protein